MIMKKIALNSLLEEWSNSNSDACIEFYLLEPMKEIDENASFPCVIICPGGGYEYTSGREAEPIALSFASRGYSAVVVRYSAPQRAFPTQLSELAAVSAWLRRNASELNLNPEKIAVCGFSAGGHLAASLCNLYNFERLQASIKVTADEIRPNAAVLCYPVITAGEFTHQGSMDNLFCEGVSPELQSKLSLENSVHAGCPPCFIWHTANDTAVPCENALLYALALRRHKVTVELHIFPNGPHGLSLAEHTTSNLATHKNESIAKWFNLCIEFLDNEFSVKRYTQ